MCGISFVFSSNPLMKHLGMNCDQIPLLLVLEHLLLTMLQQLFRDIPILHKYDSRIEVNNDLISRKSMKMIKDIKKHYQVKRAAFRTFVFFS